jgi:hypothetical protein
MASGQGSVDCLFAHEPNLELQESEVGCGGKNTEPSFSFAAPEAFRKPQTALLNLPDFPLEETGNQIRQKQSVGHVADFLVVRLLHL